MAITPTLLLVGALLSFLCAAFQVQFHLTKNGATINFHSLGFAFIVAAILLGAHL